MQLNGFDYIPKDKRKKILFLSDDLRSTSGVGNVTRDIILGTAHVFNYVQIAGLIQHPEQGKIVDVSADVNKELGIDDVSIKLYPVSGYGDPFLMRYLLMTEKPDAVIHFTDPRFWGWLYDMEAEIRQVCPIFYYTIWDDLPIPYYNKSFYESCDLLMCISKQTENIVRTILESDKEKNKDKKVVYIPHGINENKFYPIDSDNPGNLITQDNVTSTEYDMVCNYRKKLLDGEMPEFVVLFNSRNIRRKQPGDIILSFKMFCDLLPKEKAKKCALLMHTQIVDDNGTDLMDVAASLCPEYKVVFSTNRLDLQSLNFLYNAADVTINISSAEGFGLSAAESLMAGTPILVNVTGGLQDQCRFEDENGEWIKFDNEFGSNHNKKYTICGKWAFPVFPVSISLQGSLITPYIYDDRCSLYDVAHRLLEIYNLPHEERTHRGAEGRRWMLSDESKMSMKNMCNLFMEHMGGFIDNWKTPKRFGLYDLSYIQMESRPHGINYTSEFTKEINEKG